MEDSQCKKILPAALDNEQTYLHFSEKYFLYSSLLHLHDSQKGGGVVMA